MAEERPIWTTRRQGAHLFAQRVTVRTASPVALVVCSILSVVNQGSTIIEGAATWVTWVRVGVNYCGPFAVANIGFLSACRSTPADDDHELGQA